MNAHIPPEDWEEFDEGRMLATVSINGLNMHVEAIEIAPDSDPQAAKNPEHEDDLDRWYEASGSEGKLSTVTIFGREFVLFASPFCD